ncbi:MAG: RagB/SusD family nutrient uptake outer membrane protein [Bacteroidales bacterium]|nr:RagB/SusD family nutrient uptake outer membrane protein [Bacteroidales bacterium]HES58867.1 RagB/SusD family nutrient uptake outer membrane protein [Caldithrix sp.]
MKPEIERILLAGLLMLVLGACEKDEEFLDRYNTALTTEFYYSTEDQAKEGLIGIYEVLAGQALYGWKYTMMILPADDDHVDIEGWDFDVFAASMSEHEYTMQVWKALYVGVARANYFLGKVPDIEFENDQLKQRLIGEASFLRALYYWHLVMVWGEVPLVTTLLSPGEGNVPKSPAEEIYKHIESDLLIAEANLWLRSEYPLEDLGRATKGAAQALLGKLYLFWKKYDLAEEKLSNVIHSGEYNLIQSSAANPDYYAHAYAFASVFSEIPLRGTGGENNAESVFEIQYSSWVGLPFGHWFELGDGANTTLREYVMGLPQVGGWQKVLPAKDLVDSYEPDDPRIFATAWRVGDTLYADATPESDYAQFVGDIYLRGSRTGYHSKKGLYPPFPTDTRTDVKHGENNLRFLRYADVLLMYAEAVYHTGNDNPEKYMDMVRGRVGLEPVSTLMAQNNWEIPEAIMHERRLELAGEYHRFYDLRRYREKGWIEQMSDFIHGTDKDGNRLTTFVDGKNEYFPLPSSEVDLNKALEQNPNY